MAIYKNIDSTAELFANVGGGSGAGLTDEQSALLREFAFQYRANGSTDGGKQWSVSDIVSTLAAQKGNTIAVGDYIEEPDNEGNTITWVVAHKYNIGRGTPYLILIANSVYKSYTVSYSSTSGVLNLSSQYKEILDEEFNLRCSDNIAKYARANEFTPNNYFKDPTTYSIANYKSNMALLTAPYLTFNSYPAGWITSEEYDETYYKYERSNVWRFFGSDMSGSYLNQQLFPCAYSAPYTLTAIKYQPHYFSNGTTSVRANAYFTFSYRQRFYSPIVVNGSYIFAHNYSSVSNGVYAGEATNYILPCIYLMPTEQT